MSHCLRRNGAHQHRRYTLLRMRRSTPHARFAPASSNGCWRSAPIPPTSLTSCTQSPSSWRTQVVEASLAVDGTCTRTTAALTHRLSRPANFVTDALVSRATYQRAIDCEFASLVGDAGRITVSGDLDSHTASTLDRQIAVESRSGMAPLTIDLSRVTHLGSAGVSALAAARGRARSQGGDCVLVAPPGSRRTRSRTSSPRSRPGSG